MRDMRGRCSSFCENIHNECHFALENNCNIYVTQYSVKSVIWVTHSTNSLDKTLGERGVIEESDKRQQKHHCI